MPGDPEKVERMKGQKFVRGYNIAVQTLHDILHIGDESLKQTAKYYNWRIHGMMSKCKSCALAKARHKNLQKESASKSLEPGTMVIFLIFQA